MIDRKLDKIFREEDEKQAKIDELRDKISKAIKAVEDIIIDIEQFCDEDMGEQLIEIIKNGMEMKRFVLEDRQWRRKFDSCWQDKIGQDNLNILWDKVVDETNDELEQVKKYLTESAPAPSAPSAPSVISKILTVLANLAVLFLLFSFGEGHGGMGNGYGGKNKKFRKEELNPKIVIAYTKYCLEHVIAHI